MKMLLKICRNILITIISICVLIIAFLLVNYGFENNRVEKNIKKLQERDHFTQIQSDTSDIVNRLTLDLIPVPQKTMVMEGFYQIPENLSYSANDTLKEIIDNMLLNFPELNIRYSGKQGDIVILYVTDLPAQGYRMEILPGRISIEFTNPQGIFYALVSLKVLSQNHNGLLPCAMIEDFPDLPVRGLMIDISRDKVPSLETLRHIAQLASDLKFNHLELYVEGFSYAYPSFSNLWKGTETPLTPEEIRNLDVFCRSHYIDLVPNQNSLGHMASWLATDEYADLAECPDGYKFMGLIDMKTTMDPSDSRSIKLIEKMTDDLLPAFTSGNFNVNLDEPFELGHGKNKNSVKALGLEQIYLDYTLKVHDLVVKRNKKMLMWGDIILRHPGSIRKLPKDITLLDWGYESSYPFERNCQLLSESGMKFMVCPGTSSWTSITGRTNNMLGNIASATANAVKYGAEGMLLTDWGDMGHWQYLPVSYAGYVTGAALSWNSASIKKLPLTSFLNNYVFRDSRHIMGQIALDLGRYVQFEETPVPNMTTTMLTLQFGLNDRVLNNAIYEKIGTGLSGMMSDFAPEMVKAYQEQLESAKAFDYSGFITFLDEKETLLNKVILNASDGDLITAEYHNAIKLLRAGAELQYFIANQQELEKGECIQRLNSVQNNLEQYLNENQRLWLMRNKSGGYERSTASLHKLLQQVKDTKANYESPAFIRLFARFKNMMAASVSSLYLRIV